jgi:hypothetical protein
MIGHDNHSPKSRGPDGASPVEGETGSRMASCNVPGAQPHAVTFTHCAVESVVKTTTFLLAVPPSVAAFLRKLEPKRQITKTLMQKTNRLMQSSVSLFATVLAIFLFTGCKSEPSSCKVSSNATTTTAPAAAPVVAATPAAAPAVAPAPAKTPEAPTAPAAPAANVVPAAAPVAAAAATPVTAPVVPPVRIKAGIPNSFTDAEGNVWLPDQGFTGGETYEVPDASITNTPDPAIYRTERYSMTSFSYPVPNGKYTVKLHFAEVYEGITGPGNRVFSFNVEGHEIKDFDIWVKAGGPNRACVETVNVEVTDGKLDISFTPKEENPKINGIEILPGP